MQTSEYPLRIIAAITFHFREARLRYLFEVVRALCEYPVEALEVVVVTNTDSEAALEQIKNVCAPLFTHFPSRPTSRKALLIESFPKLSDPWILPWSHKHLISDRFLYQDSAYTHFIYVEDDVRISFDNFCYFVRYREMLKNVGLIPSFQRVEYNNADNHLYLLDQVGAADFSTRNSVSLDGYAFVNPDFPFNAMFILDRELALEYVGTQSFDRKRSKVAKPDWDVACRAAMGLCFEDPPQGFSGRYVVPVDPVSLIAPCWSLVYHLPNNYVMNRFKPFAKTRVDQQFGAGESAVAWRPPSKLDTYIARLSGWKRPSGPNPTL
jgi:hypothetical protein